MRAELWYNSYIQYFTAPPVFEPDRAGVSSHCCEAGLFTHRSAPFPIWILWSGPAPLRHPELLVPQRFNSFFPSCLCFCVVTPIHRFRVVTY